MKKRAAAAKSKEHEEHTRKFQEFSKRVEAELHALPDDFTSVSRTATLTRYLIARQYDVDKAFKVRRYLVRCVVSRQRACRLTCRVLAFADDERFARMARRE